MMTKPSGMHERFRAISAAPSSGGRGGGCAEQELAPVRGDWSREPELLALLLRPIAPTESAFEGHARKEREIGGLFASLPVIEAMTLHRRLACPRPDDQLATAFGRLLVERRGRLLGFLADARRRAATSAASAASLP